MCSDTFVCQHLMVKQFIAAYLEDWLTVVLESMLSFFLASEK